MAQKEEKSPAVDVAKERKDRDEAVVLSTGIKARFVPVAASLINDVVSRIKNPPVPIVFLEEKQREEENPNDPEYIRLVQEAEDKRTQASLDTIILFGVDLVDGVPEDDGWLKKLKYMEKLDHLDLKKYDLDDPDEREFVYKRFIAVSSDDIIEVLRRSGITEEDIAQAMKTFPSQTP